jgi:hypothetical protein
MMVGILRHPGVLHEHGEYCYCGWMDGQHLRVNGSIAASYDSMHHESRAAACCVPRVAASSTVMLHPLSSIHLLVVGYPTGGG